MEDNDFRRLLKKHGMTQIALAKRFDIPIRTVQAWATGERQCSDYILKMMSELLDHDANRSAAVTSPAVPESTGNGSEAFEILISGLRAIVEKYDEMR